MFPISSEPYGTGWRTDDPDDEPSFVGKVGPEGYIHGWIKVGEGTAGSRGMHKGDTVAATTDDGDTVVGVHDGARGGRVSIRQPSGRVHKVPHGAVRPATESENSQMTGDSRKRNWRKVTPGTVISSGDVIRHSGGEHRVGGQTGTPDQHGNSPVLHLIGGGTANRSDVTQVWQMPGGAGAAYQEAERQYQAQKR